MSNRFHSKYHRHNHHTYTNVANPDSGHDPIASPAAPFQGDFVIAGGLSASAPTSAYAGTFFSYNTALVASSPLTASTGLAFLANGNVRIKGNLVVDGSFPSPTTLNITLPTYNFSNGIISTVAVPSTSSYNVSLNYDTSYLGIDGNQKLYVKINDIKNALTAPEGSQPTTNNFEFSSKHSKLGLESYSKKCKIS